MTTTSHADHDHEATSSARAACRKATAIATSTREVAIDDLIAAFATRGLDWEPLKFLFYATSRFCQAPQVSDPREAAALVLTHFLPSGDAAKDSSRTRNGYTITPDPQEMVRITMRAAS